MHGVEIVGSKMLVTFYCEDIAFLQNVGNHPTARRHIPELNP